MTEKLTNNSLRTAVFAGSFNPFTVGHASIVERGLNIFDRIIVAIGVNADKPESDVTRLEDKLRKLYQKCPRVKVMTWKGLMVDLARKENAAFFLRGVRNVADFEYERNMADINKRLSGIETVLLFALPDHAAITSSVVRELESYGADITSLVP